MYEYRGNMHIHTCYSDGSGTHDDVARAAMEAGLDFVITTDHNIWIDGFDGYYYIDRKRVLLLTGEEIHDTTRNPQKNHLLVYEARKELADSAADPQGLIHAVRDAGGSAFIAHPFDPEASRFNEPDLSWVNWEVEDYSGLEIWNAMSEFKSRLNSIPSAVWHSLNPETVARGPFPETLELWDKLLISGKKVAAVGGADAHANTYELGPFKRVLFPYKFHFRAINTHILIEQPLSGEVDMDRVMVHNALRRGNSFVAYDLPAPTDGFRFYAQTDQESIQMGEEGTIRFGATLQIRLPYKATIHLIRDGSRIQYWSSTAHAVHTVTKPGIYRVECYRPYKGSLRGWIFSNPIYLRI